MEDSQRASYDEINTVILPAAATEHSQDPGEINASFLLAAATEHRQDASTPQLAFQELPADKEMIYSIVNEILGKSTFNNPEAEEVLVATLQDEACLPRSMQLLLDEVFSPIFFHYPNGLKDRSVWEPRDTSKYIGEWYNYAAMRTWVNTDATATELGEQLSKGDVTKIWNKFLEDFKTTLRPEQLNKKWTYYKGCAETKMRRETGHTFVANSIWATGLPRLPPFATERREQQLSAEDLEEVPQAIYSVLNWLDHIASAKKQHQTTPDYKESLRKSGVAHGISGLTATELETRTAFRKAKYAMFTAKQLDTQWRTGSLTQSNCYHWQWNLLCALWNGSVQRRLEEASCRRSGEPMRVHLQCDRDDEMSRPWL